MKTLHMAICFLQMWFQSSILLFVSDQNGYCQPHAQPSATYKLQNENNKKPSEVAEYRNH